MSWLLRNILPKKSDHDPLREMVKLLNMDKTPSQSYSEYISQLDLWACDMAEIIKTSNWKTTGNPGQMDVTQVTKLMVFSKLLNDCDGVTAEKLHKDLKKTPSFGEVDYLLQGYVETAPGFNPYVMPVNVAQNRQQGARASRPLSRNRSPDEYRARSV